VIVTWDVVASAPVLAWGAYAWGSQALAVAAACRTPRRRPAVALTFDDGPDPEHTPRVLDRLAATGARATFFLIGERARMHGALVRRMVAEGHQLGNHTMRHRSLWLAGPRRTVREVRDGHDAIAQVAGVPPRFFRPPWGLTNLAMLPVLRRLGTPCVLWTIQPEKLRAVAPAAQVARTLRRARPGAIVDLHDADGVPGAGARIVEALPAMIAGLRARGYAMAALGDLL
jgi:peptidoglycan/xylan/chitin deacetylase (PgdA/CDA1 family)